MEGEVRLEQRLEGMWVGPSGTVGGRRLSLELGCMAAVLRREAGEPRQTVEVSEVPGGAFTRRASEVGEGWGGPREHRAHNSSCLGFETGFSEAQSIRDRKSVV